MHVEIARHREAVAALCRQFGVARLDVFGSAARGSDFDPQVSDADLLVQFAPQDISFAAFLDLKDALETLLGRSVDLVERQAVEASRNPYRKTQILNEAQPLYAA